MIRTRPRILLCAMPDTAMAFRRVGNMPNLGLPSLAAAVTDADVRILDLHVRFYKVAARLKEELKVFKPDIVGLSAMSFQIETARQLAKSVKEYNPEIKVVLGGYHASMAARTFTFSDSLLFDLLIRGEAEVTFRHVVERFSRDNNFADIKGVSYFASNWVHNPVAPLASLQKLALPRRESRMETDFFLFGKRIETVETSRGCTLPCNFCSISKMYGSSFRTYPIERIIEDIKICHSRGAEMIFFVDDNITLDVERLKTLCGEIIKNGLNTVEYISQMSVNGIVKDPDLTRVMKEAGFTVVFLGIENVSPVSLKEMKKGDIRKAAALAISLCKKNNIAVIGGFIAGLPDDGPEEIRFLFKEIRRLKVDHVIVQCVTPYPNTEFREKLLNEGLVVNSDDYTRYNGYICNVRTRKMSVHQLNRILNWENIKLYFDPRFIRANKLLQRENSRKWKGRVLINSLEHFSAFFTNKLFYSRHTL